MAKIVIEHVTKIPRVRLSVFINEKKVGQIKKNVRLEIEMPPGDHLLHIGFEPNKLEGVGVPFHVAEGSTKKIRTSLTRSALFAAKWHVFLAVASAGILSFCLGWMLSREVRVITLILAVIFFLGAFLNYFLVNAKRRQAPKNFIEIEVLE